MTISRSNLNSFLQLHPGKSLIPPSISRKTSHTREFQVVGQKFLKTRQTKIDLKYQVNNVTQNLIDYKRV